MLVIAFSNRLSEKLKYLERCADSPCPNDELSATPAQTVKGILDELDMLISKHIVDHAIEVDPQKLQRRTKARLAAEKQRRVTLANWWVLENVPGGETRQTGTAAN